MEWLLSQVTLPPGSSLQAGFLQSAATAPNRRTPQSGENSSEIGLLVAYYFRGSFLEERWQAPARLAYKHQVAGTVIR